MPFSIAISCCLRSSIHLRRCSDRSPDVSLPANEFAPAGLPAVAFNPSSEFKSYPDNAKAARAAGYKQATALNASWTRWQRKAYFAAASFMDAQLGKVISRRRDCHYSAAPPSPFSRCFNVDGEGVSVK